MTLYKWSRTAASNASADSTCPFPEGMAPSALNDGTRGMMAAISKYRDDSNGSISSGGTGAIGGTSAAYTLTSNQGFSSTATMNLQEITFCCQITNVSGVTLNVDGLGAFPICGVFSTPIPAGAMLAGGVYTLTFYANQWVLHAYQPQWSTGDVKLTLKSTADAGWVMCDDGTIGDAASGSSNRTNADTLALFTLIYGAVSDAFAPLFLSNGVLTNRANQGSAATAFAGHCRLSLTKVLGRSLGIAGAGAGLTSRALGQTVGSEINSLVTANLPPYTPSGSIANGAITSTFTSKSGQISLNNTIGGASQFFGGSLGVELSQGTVTSTQAASSFTGTPQGGTSAAFSVQDPTSYLNAMVKL